MLPCPTSVSNVLALSLVAHLRIPIDLAMLVSRNTGRWRRSCGDKRWWRKMISFKRLANCLFRVRLVLFILHSVVLPCWKFGLLCQGESLASCRDLLSSLVKVTGIYFLFLSRETNVCCQGILGVHLLQAHGSSLFVLFVCARPPSHPSPSKALDIQLTICSWDQGEHASDWDLNPPTWSFIIPDVYPLSHATIH